MKTDFFSSGTVNVGGKDLAFRQQEVQGRFALYVPADFFVDKNLVSQYTYLFSQDKSPLSIAVKFTKISQGAERTKMISNYFSQTKRPDPDPITELEPGAYYRESVTSGKLLSVYSLRFSIEAEDGVLFGCFNCSADYKGDWRPVILEMLHNVERLEAVAR